jgi:hypothetical protein
MLKSPNIFCFRFLCLAVLFFLILPAVVQAQFTFTTNNSTITITGYTGTCAVVTIPAAINDYPVTSIASYAFPGNISLTNVTIGTGITNIGDYAFSDCTSLTAINVDASNPDYSSVDGVLFDQTRTTLIQYPASKTGTCYTIPYGVVSIGGASFYDSQSLTNVAIPNSVTSIGLESFYDCLNLLVIKIPNSVTNIGDWAFWACSSLNTVTIPASVTSIGSFAFLDCISLGAVYFEGDAPTDGGSIFGNDNGVTVDYLPGTTGWGATFGGVPAVLWNPQATAFITAGNQFGFNITGPTNATIVVEACTNLANPVWLPVSTNTLSGSGTASFNDPQWANYPNRYYRFSAP